MKRIIDFLIELPYPYRDEAVSNFVTYIHYNTRKEEKVSHLANAIDRAFCWENTSQGHSYWDMIYHKSLLGNIKASVSYSKYLKK